MPTPATSLETYRTRWEEFRIDCANLNAGRRWLMQGYANEDLEASEDELWARVCAFEDRIAHLSVFERASRLASESYRYADM